jgi:hypothetical protein
VKKKRATGLGELATSEKSFLDCILNVVRSVGSWRLAEDSIASFSSTEHPS